MFHYIKTFNEFVKGDNLIFENVREEFNKLLKENNLEYIIKVYDYQKIKELNKVFNWNFKDTDIDVTENIIEKLRILKNLKKL